MFDIMVIVIVVVTTIVDVVALTSIEVLLMKIVSYNLFLVHYLNLHVCYHNCVYHSIKSL